MTTSAASDAPAIPDLNGKVVLITGGSTGIGAAVALGFARSGARVAINFRSNVCAAETVARAVDGAGGEAFLAQADVTEPGAAADVVARSVARFGRLDILVNNAGALTARTPTVEASDAYIDAMLALNSVQVVRFVREAVPHFRRQGGGCIINVTSIAARHGGGPGSVLYAASKGFVSTATRGWAKEFVGDRIRVNAVAPGVIATPFHERATSAAQMEAMRQTIPMGRIGEPDECVGAFLYLASEQLSGYVTGQILEVNGGQYMP